MTIYPCHRIIVVHIVFFIQVIIICGMEADPLRKRIMTDLGEPRGRRTDLDYVKKTRCHYDSGPIADLTYSAIAATQPRRTA